jgi:hypothetical protein
VRWAKNVAGLRKRKNSHRVLVGKPDGKKPLGKPMFRCKDNTKMDFKENRWDRGDWIHLAPDRQELALLNAVLHHKVPLKVRNL